MKTLKAKQCGGCNWMHGPYYTELSDSFGVCPQILRTKRELIDAFSVLALPPARFVARHLSEIRSWLPRSIGQMDDMTLVVMDFA